MVGLGASACDYLAPSGDEAPTKGWSESGNKRFPTRGEFERGWKNRLICDRLALSIQHGLDKLSATKDFNRAYET
jgi:hypothetical protein